MHLKKNIVLDKLKNVTSIIQESDNVLPLIPLPQDVDSSVNIPIEIVNLLKVTGWKICKK